MISELLDRDFVLTETRAQRDWLAAVQARVLKKDPAALAELKKQGITPAQIARVIAALDDALARANGDQNHPAGIAYIPSDPVTNGLQKGLTHLAIAHGQVERNLPASAPSTSAKAITPSRANRGARSPAKPAPDTSPPLRLRKTSATTGTDRVPFVEGTVPFWKGADPLYALDGFKAKFGGLFTKRRPFNDQPARIASSPKPLTLFLFGDWGTGLDLAAEVTRRVGEQLAEVERDPGRQPHVIHLGDVYYVGDAEEYQERMLPFWPVSADRKEAVGSWSLNGNHDMYAGGWGYFDTLLRQDVMLRWHGDARGEPSSFFLIEDPDWQVFGLDTSWNLPSLKSTIFGKPTKADYGGQNGLLTEGQAAWMARQRNPAKGCILLTHHQPASSRSSESQHADQAVALLKAAGVYSQIDAWIWGHEHRGVVFKPKAERTTKRLRDAPEFCACLGHGGVPVTERNFEAAHRITDVWWDEDRLDDGAPIYEGLRVVPFGFARIDTRPGAFEFRAFDHAGKERFWHVVQRTTSAAIAKGRTTPPRSAAPPRRVKPEKVAASLAPSTRPTPEPMTTPSAAATPPRMAKPAKATAPPPKPAAVADWTILVFMAGDNNLDDFGASDLLEMKKVGSSDRLHIVVQRDSAAAGLLTQRYLVTKGTHLEDDVVQSLGETNTGDPKVLAEFLKWGRTHYPAKRTMAVLWNHGSGWDDTDIYAEARRRGLNPPAPPTVPGAGGPRRAAGPRGRIGVPAGFVNRSAARRRFRGPFFLTAYRVEKRRAIAFDDGAQDFLDSVEMKNVFQAAAKAAGRKFDVIGMDACLMSMVETAIQVQSSGEVFCGSQEIEPGQGWPYDRILKALAAKPTMDGRELTKIIVKEFVGSYAKGQAVTQSAFDLAALSQVQKAADALGTFLARAYRQTGPNADFATQGAITGARYQSQGYDHPDYVDLSDFCGRLAENLPSAKDLAKRVQDAVAACVFANSAPNPKVAGSHGISIYLPMGKLSPLYQKLDFAKGGWGDFLNARHA